MSIQLFSNLTQRHYVEASSHGRFQPPHKGHLEYLITAKQRCDFLWVGITQPDVLRLLPVDGAPHRVEVSANPLTYFERLEILTEMLVAEGVPRNDFSFIPFPVEEPASLAGFLSTRIPCLTTIYDEWNRQKVRLLNAEGYTVDVLYERSFKEFEGRRIRENVAIGGEEWESMVPAVVARELKKLQFANRITRGATLHPMRWTAQ